MNSFVVSSPGKVILFGEHAVVHEKVCLLKEQRLIYYRRQ